MRRAAANRRTDRRQAYTHYGVVTMTDGQHQSECFCSGPLAYIRRKVLALND
jgi:hypothetical protein